MGQWHRIKSPQVLQIKWPFIFLIEYPGLPNCHSLGKAVAGISNTLPGWSVAIQYLRKKTTLGTVWRTNWTGELWLEKEGDNWADVSLQQPTGGFRIPSRPKNTQKLPWEGGGPHPSPCCSVGYLLAQSRLTWQNVNRLYKMCFLPRRHRFPVGWKYILQILWSKDRNCIPMNSKFNLKSLLG